MIDVRVVGISINNSEMTVNCETTNSEFPGVVLTYSTLHGCGQTWEGVQRELDAGAELLWIGHKSMQWKVAERAK